MRSRGAGRNRGNDWEGSWKLHRVYRAGIECSLKGQQREEKRESREREVCEEKNVKTGQAVDQQSMEQRGDRSEDDGVDGACLNCRCYFRAERLIITA